MKKIFMFLLMACLVGGFANNANAQGDNLTPAKSQSTQSANSQSKKNKPMSVQPGKPVQQQPARKKGFEPQSSSENEIKNNIVNSLGTPKFIESILQEYEAAVDKCIKYWNKYKREKPTPSEKAEFEKNYKRAKELEGKLKTGTLEPALNQRFQTASTNFHNADPQK